MIYICQLCHNGDTRITKSTPAELDNFNQSKAGDSSAMDPYNYPDGKDLARQRRWCLQESAVYFADSTVEIEL